MSIPGMIAGMKHVEAPLRDLDHLHLRLFCTANPDIDRSWNAEDVCSSYWRFYVNSRPGASVLLTDGTYPLAAKRIHFIPAWVRFTCHNTATIDHLFAHFDLIGLPGAVVRACFPTPLTLPANAPLEAACERLRPRLRGSESTAPATLCRVKAVIFESLGVVFDGLATEPAARLFQFTRASNPVATALLHIDDHLGDPLGNNFLARLCGFGEDHFARLFRQHVGQTPAQYVLERRIAVSAEKLLFSNLTIDEIAEQCGFPNRFYFTRVFTKRMAASPAAYRRAARV